MFETQGGNVPETEILEIPIETFNSRAAFSAFFDRACSVGLYALLGCIIGGWLARMYGNDALESAFSYCLNAIAALGVASLLLVAVLTWWIRRRSRNDLRFRERARVLWHGPAVDLAVCRKSLNDDSLFPLKVPYHFFHMGLSPPYSVAALLAVLIFSFALAVLGGFPAFDAVDISIAGLIVFGLLVHTLIPGRLRVSRGSLEITVMNRLTGNALISRTIALDSALVKIKAIAPTAVGVSAPSDEHRSVTLYNLPYPVCWCILAASLR